MRNRLNGLHAWSMQWANTKWGTWALFICAFADASFLPLPTPMFFLALVLLNFSKAHKYAFLATLGTLSGAVVGYSIGHLAWLNLNGDFTALAQFLFNHIPGFTESVYNQIHLQYSKWDFWILFIAPYIPVPYKIFSISSGIFNINVFMFCIATLIGQGLRFYALSFLIIKIGPKVKNILEYNLKPIAFIAAACIAITVFVIKVF
jgi:membrane protein YqaA with SNARE-associated domain